MKSRFIKDSDNRRCAIKDAKLDCQFELALLETVYTL